MMGRLEASLQMLKQSWNFLMGNKDLLILPIISAITTLLFLLLVLGVSMTAVPSFNRLSNFMQDNTAVSVILAFVMYFMTAFITIFFNASLVACATERFQGRSCTIVQGIKLVTHKVPQVIGWALVSSTVGLLLRSAEESHGMVRDIIVGIIGAAWSLITFLVLPLLVVEGLGPFAAIKKSAQLFGRGWGRVLTANVVVTLLTMLAIGVVVGLGFLMPNADTAYMITAGITIIAVIFLVSMAFGAAFNGIAMSAIYLALARKQDPQGIDADVLMRSLRWGR